MIKQGLHTAVAPRGIPIELSSLLSPYEGYPHLSLRVERLPMRARLSRGRNNGDRTWSLTPDDLDGLAYLPPDAKAEPPTLTIRIISVDDDHGATLAVLDFPVLRGDAVAELAPGATDPDVELEIRRLRDALAAMAERTGRTIDSELAAARTRWGVELAERLTEAAALAAANLEKNRAAWQAEQQEAKETSTADEAVRHAAVEAQWREQFAGALAAAAQAARAELETAVAETRQELEQSWSEKSRQTVETALSAARTAWDAELAARLSDAVAAADANLEKNRAAWLVEQQNRIAQSDARAAERAGERFEHARQAWKADEAVRLAAAEDRWQKQSARALAEATEAARETAVAETRRDLEQSWAEKSQETIETELISARTDWDAELAARLAEAAAVHAANLETQRAAWLAEQDDRLARSDAQAQQRIEQSRQAWKADEAVRLNAAEERWREKSARALTEAAQAARAELTAARTAWDAELAARLAEAASEASEKFAGSRAAWLAEQHDRAAQAEAQAQDRIEQARRRWQHEAEAALIRAEEGWKTDEAARLAAAETQWREHTVQALTQATARFERAEAALAETVLAETRDQGKAADGSGAADELRRLRNELAVAQALLADHEASAVETRQRLEQAWAEKSRQTIEAGLTASRTGWGAELAERLGEAAALAAANLERSRAAWQAEQDERAQERIDQAHEGWQQEAAAALSTAQEAWKADEAARLAAAEAEWRAPSAPAARNPDGDDELHRLRDALAALQADTAETRQRLEQAWVEKSRKAIETELTASRTAWGAELAERLGEAAKAAAANLEKSRAAWQAEQDGRAQDRIDAAREAWQHEATAALSNAEEAWKAEEAARLAAAEAGWREQSARALAEATARLELAEAAPADARAPDEAARDPGADDALRRLRDETAAMRSALAERESELAQARSAAEQARERLKTEIQAILCKAEDAWKLAEAQRLSAAQAAWQKDAKFANAKSAYSKAINRQSRAKVTRHVIRGGAVAASLAAAAFLYPRVEPMIVEGWWPKLHQLAVTRIESLRGNDGAPVASQVAAPVQVAERHVLIDVSQVKLRAGPSTSTPVITTLARDKEVTQIERRGYWVLVRFSGEDGRDQQEGWIYGSFLKDADSR